jgi:ribosome-associated protein
MEQVEPSPQSRKRNPTTRSPAPSAKARARRLSIACARIADKKKAEDICILSVGKQLFLTDYFVICTGKNPRQLQAIAEAIDSYMAKRQVKRLGREGYPNGTWILLDYGDVICHLFTEEMRQFYELEELWAQARRIKWQRK